MLQRHGARVSERCSIHIHVDGNGFDLEGIKRLVQNTRAYEPWIYQIARGCSQPIRATFGAIGAICPCADCAQGLTEPRIVR